MSTRTNSVEITLRIPGNWTHPSELVKRLPVGYRLSPEGLHLPDGARVAISPMPPDDQFAQIFHSSCRRPATVAETEIVDHYTVNIGLTGPGGSLAAAQSMMQAGAAIVRAGGAGVFIDNCGLAHGGEEWLKMTENGGPDALSFAFVNIVRGKQVLWTMGMQVLGLPDLSMPSSSLAAKEELLIDLIRYIAASDKPIGHGHIFILDGGHHFQATATDESRFEPGSPMHNPFGRLKLLSEKDIAEQN